MSKQSRQTLSGVYRSRTTEVLSGRRRSVFRDRLKAVRACGAEVGEQVTVVVDAVEDILGGEHQLGWVAAGTDFVPM